MILGLLSPPVTLTARILASSSSPRDEQLANNGSFTRVEANPLPHMVGSTPIVTLFSRNCFRGGESPICGKMP